MSSTFTFNSIAIASVVPDLRVIATTPYRYPNIDVATDPLAAADKSVTSSSYIKSKKINVTCEIGVTNRASLDNSIDTLYQYLQGVEKTLLLDVGSSTRQWTATLSNIAVSDVQGGLATIDIEFTAADPFGNDTSSTTLFSTSFTGNNVTTNFWVPIQGSAPWQVPIFTITFTAVNRGSNTNFYLGNPATGQTITITRIPIAADIFVIDCGARTVTVNGNATTSYTGAFPEWSPGSGASVSYSDDYTTRTVTLAGTYTKRFI